MASVIEQDSVREVHGLLQESRWDDAIAFYEQELSRSDKALADARLAYAIALIRGGREAKGLASRAAKRLQDLLQDLVGPVGGPDVVR